MKMFGEDATIWGMKQKMTNLSKQHKIAVTVLCVLGVLAAIALIALMVSKFCKNREDYDCCDCFDEEDDFGIFDHDDFEEPGVHHMEHGLAGDANNL